LHIFYLYGKWLIKIKFSFYERTWEYEKLISKFKKHEGFKLKQIQEKLLFQLSKLNIALTLYKNILFRSKLSSLSNFINRIIFQKYQ